LPWRRTRDPYQILVSEIMLQQTQVARVLEFYPRFIARFPDFRRLSRASLRLVLKEWQGLGYNRRALMLKKLSGVIMERHGGTLPADHELLLELPGIGKATAGAVLAFAFRKPAVFIETNIRRVYLHFFFPGCGGVRDAEIFPLVVETLDRRNPREWYYALMDYGAMLAKTVRNPNRRSAHFKTQSRFRGSLREGRGAIIRAFSTDCSLSLAQLQGRCPGSGHIFSKALEALRREGFLHVQGERVSITEDGIAPHIWRD